MTVIEFYEKLSELYPTSLSCEWDNDGLMVCPDKNAQIKKVLVSLDATDGAIKAAMDVGADLILTHHPLIFRPLKSLTPDNVTAKRAISAFTAGISVISLHTRPDAGDGGVNDALASALGLAEIEKFGGIGADGMGRIGVTSETSLPQFAECVKNKLGASVVTYSGSRPVKRVAVLGGSGGDFFSAAVRAGADTIVTGEAGYNSTIDTAEGGLNVVLGGHYFTENPVCEVLAGLAKNIAGAEVVVYSSNTVGAV